MTGPLPLPEFYSDLLHARRSLQQWEFDRRVDYFYLRPRPYRPGGEIADENILQSPDDLTDPIWDVNSLDVALVDDNPIGEIEEYFSLIEKAEEDDHY